MAFNGFIVAGTLIYVLHSKLGLSLVSPTPWSLILEILWGREKTSKQSWKEAIGFAEG